MPLDRDLVRRKLSVITANLKDLEPVRDLSLDAYRADRMRKKGVERLLQESIEAAVDANQHILRNTAGGPVADYFESFVRLGEAGVIPRELAQSLAPAAGLRNRLVHEYDVLDDAIVLAAAGDACDLLARYVAAVQRFLSA